MHFGFARIDGRDDGHQFLDVAFVLGADKPGHDAVEYLRCFHERVRSLLTVTRTTFARGAFLPQMQTIYCNWWDAEEPRKWTRDIDEQKSNQEKIRIRTLKTVGCGTRREKNGLSAEEALTVHSRQLKEQGGEKDLTQRAQRRRRGHR